MGKLKKFLKISIISVIILVVVVIAFISPITKYLIEKFDKKYTGREITMDWAYVNPFTGYLHFDNLKIFEFNRDTVFFSAKGLSANIAMSKLLSKTYEISEITLNKPRGLIIQNKKYFNFNDLITKFSPKENSKKDKPPVHFNIRNIKIIEGEFYYRETATPINYFIKNVNISSSGVNWDVDSIPIEFSFLSGIGRGDVKGDFTVNSKSKDYRLAIIVNKFDLNIIGQYIKDLTNYGAFRAVLDADFKSKGNLIEREDVTNSGLISISDFHFGKNVKEDFASFDNLTVSIKEVSPQKHTYLFDSIALKHPYFKYEKYDYLDNVQTMFGKNGANVKSVKADPDKYNLVIEIAEYLKVISKNLFSSDYKVGRLAITEGDIKFNDYTLSEKFAIELTSFSVMADSINKHNKRVKIALKSVIKPYGNVAINLSINPKDSSDFDLHYTFKKIAASMFNPYLIKYTSFPLDRGTIELKGDWHVKNGNINSHNHLVIIDPRVSNRTRNKNSKWIPMRLIMFFVRERGNVIDYEIPIQGNLNKPDFKFRDVIFDVLENIFVKPITTPYRIEVKNVETEIEESLYFNWGLNSSTHAGIQERFLKKLVVFLEDNPSSSIGIHPNNYTIKEKEYILLFEAKKLYFMKANTKSIHSLNKRDTAKINTMSIKDPLFISYLNREVNDSMVFTVQEKCLKLIGANSINVLFKKLLENRKELLMRYFANTAIKKQVKFFAGKDIVPFNGFSFYKIEYKGELPDYLINAYSKMNELNNQAPRNKFKKERR